MKKLLVIRVSTDVMDESIRDIYCHARHYKIEPFHKDVKTIEELSSALSDGNQYDYLYFAGHGNGQYLGDNKDFSITWSEVGSIICDSNCLKQGSIVMLYCCKGGFNTVAFQLMASCNNIEYVCGAKQSIKNIDAIIGFNVFMYNIENRRIDPSISAKKATKATDIRFECFDRTEVEANPHYYYNYCPDCIKENS